MHTRSMASALESREIKRRCFRLLLRPLVRFAIRHSFTIKELFEEAKRVFIDEAKEEILKKSKKVNVSRISLITGLYRREVKALLEAPEETEDDAANIVARVLGQWEQDSRYQTKSGSPRVLSYDGDGSEFWSLVHSVSKHMNPGTVLFELERSGSVEKTSRGLKVITRTLHLEEDPEKGFKLLSKDLDDFIHAVEENLYQQISPSHSHVRTEYDNIDPQDVEQIRLWLVREGKLYHRKLRDFLAKFDRDINPDAEKSSGRARVSVGVYSYSCSE